jgi:hypothetical protein
LGIHAVKKYQKHTGASDPTDPLTYTFEDMTEAEVTTMSNDWYDNYIGGR